jgi:hypothetical protein
MILLVGNAQTMIKNQLSASHGDLNDQYRKISTETMASTTTVSSRIFDFLEPYIIHSGDKLPGIGR